MGGRQAEYAMAAWQRGRAIAILLMTAGAAGAVPDDLARVLDVTPVYDRVRVTVPQRHCWKEHDQAAADGSAALRRRCTTVDSTELREEQVGYLVRYLYRGRIGRMRTQFHPGERIRLQYDLQAIHF